ncbi:DsbA family oxidoreductase [Adhaeribacter aquaticus]|uniref:DsbA family oxidoreductase n=1 Tax=Adhaeribacter aquaticus TaxID=299567 RepID=UPI0003F66117|nr:DsbA family oxidoreductase [Adhaeribacter aquaticus]
MKIDIWSDIACPFCYIGKRKFEQALEQFPHKDQVEVVWHSFQLDPEMQFVPGKSINEVLAEKKGWSPQQAKQMNAQVTGMAKEVGLDYNMDQTIPANTFHAHRLTHLAAKHGLQDQAEERLFQAYFMEGKNIGDTDTLVQLGTEIGLEEALVRQTLENNLFANEVNQDSFEAQQLGIRGVPFFVLNRKYGVSGAQPSELFLQTLEKVWEEEKPVITPITTNEGQDASCSDGMCEV